MSERELAYREGARHALILSIIVAILAAMMLVMAPWMRACEAEDSISCTWNAQEQGNGEGQSFVNWYGVIIPVSNDYLNH